MPADLSDLYFRPTFSYANPFVTAQPQPQPQPQPQHNKKLGETR